MSHDVVHAGHGGFEHGVGHVQHDGAAAQLEQKLEFRRHLGLGLVFVVQLRENFVVVVHVLIDEFVRTFPGALDAKGTTEDLERVAPLIPDEWLAPSASGTPQQCVAAIRNQFALGCDGVIMHGATPTELAPIVAAYKA